MASRNYDSIFGPGYRVYYAIRGSQVVLVLCGGNKSTQQADRAKQILKDQ